MTVLVAAAKLLLLLLEMGEWRGEVIFEIGSWLLLVVYTYYLWEVLVGKVVFNLFMKMVLVLTFNSKLVQCQLFLVQMPLAPLLTSQHIGAFGDTWEPSSGTWDRKDPKNLYLKNHDIFKIPSTFGKQIEQMRCWSLHMKMGADAGSRQTGHSSSFCLASIFWLMYSRSCTFEFD